MARKKKRNRINGRACLVAAGVFVILLALSFLLSSGTHLSFLGGYVFSYLFGVVGYFGFPALFIIQGLALIIPKMRKVVGFRFAIGYILGLFATCALVSAGIYNGAHSVAEYQIYHDAFIASGKIPFGYSFNGNLGGGALGFVLSNVLPNASLIWVVRLVAIIVLVLAVFLMFFSLWKMLFRDIRAGVAISKARRKQRHEERVRQIKEEEHERETRIPMEEAGERPTPKKPANPLDSLVFEPAKDASVIPSRASRYHTQQETRPVEQSNEATYETSYPHPSAPRVMPNPNAALYRDSALRNSGLQEAFFDPTGSFAEQASPAVPPQSAPKPQPTQPLPQPQPYETPAVVDPYGAYVPPHTPSTARAYQGQGEIPTPSIFDQTPQEPVLDEVEQKPVQGTLFDEQAFAPLPDVAEQPHVEPVPSPLPTPAPVQPAPSVAQVPTPEPTPAAPAVEEKKEEDEEEVPLPPYQYPPISLLTVPQNAQNIAQMEQECAEKEAIINQTFIDLGVGAHVAGHTIGPSVTRYAIQPDRNVSVASLARYVKDIEVRIGGVPTRYAERVTGMTTPALETANNVVRMVSLKECIEALPPLSEKTRMIVPFGVKITGECVYANLTEFPHLLLAGTTGSGKSIFVHSMLLALIMRNRPEELKLVLVDPKRVEMTKYKDIPHLLCPIVKEPVHAKNALKKLVEEMERRYRLFDNAAVQKIEEYNTDYAPVYHKKKLPYIVIVVDEFADLVNNCKEVSEYVLTLGAKARACGIHMIIATQRPDAKTISGTIKANLPTAVALSVRSSTDSIVILGSAGAEDLAGHGDMLIDCAQIAKKEFVRAQGCFVDNRELRAIPEFVRSQQAVKYHPAFLDLDDKEEEAPEEASPYATGGEGGMPTPAPAPSGDGEAKYQYIKSVIMTREFTSISQIQRDFSVGFPRAGKIFARLQKEGIVDLTPVSSSKGCRVLIHEEASSSSAGSVSTSTTEPSWKSDPEEDIG